MELERTLAPTSLTDEQLVERVVGGDVSSFEALMRRHNERLFRATRAILKNDAEAEDAMQEAYLSAYRHLSDFRGTARFSTWLLRIAVNEALHRRKRARPHEPLDENDSMSEDVMGNGPRSPETITVDRELARAVEAAIDALPEPFRVVFVLRAVQQLSAAEVAEALGIPEETVKTRLHRARMRIQAMLTNRTDALTPSLFDFHLSRCDRIVQSVLSKLAS